ncbi:tetratricopeptide repeat protein [Nocardiopsis listeri]|uniref:tetratricopeptide repeat protein n=1 Tax=Nocardiopsis listeri TaxID=53440 RepID=UPI000AFDF664|nr:tetratricopeptide repeat protein [Nocardiopsis listeri]
MARWFGGRWKKKADPAEVSETSGAADSSGLGRSAQGPEDSGVFEPSSVPPGFYDGADELMDRAHAHLDQDEFARAEILFEAASDEYRRATESLGAPRASGEVVLKIAMASRMRGRALIELGRFEDAVDAGAEALALLQQFIPDQDFEALIRDAPELADAYASALDEVVVARVNATVRAAQEERADSESLEETLLHANAALTVRNLLLDRHAPRTWSGLAGALVSLGHLEMLLGDGEKGVPRVTRANAILLNVDSTDPLKRRAAEALRAADGLYPQILKKNPVPTDPREAL